jgi:hypothetical protein
MRNLLALLTTPARAFWRALVSRRRLALLLIPFGLAAERAQAADDSVRWTPVQQTQTERMRNDLELTLRARRLLVEDPVLARYDIQVRIDDRVAELTGPVPSTEIAQLAEISLRHLTGLASIRNRIAIHAPVADARKPGESARGDWNLPPAGFSESAGTQQLAARYSAVSSEPTFAWRPVRRTEDITSLPLPFVAEGISRPTVGREQLREADTLNRENLRIGRVDVIKTPAEPREIQKAPAVLNEVLRSPTMPEPEPELLQLPPIHIRVIAEPAQGTAPTNELRVRLAFLVY